MPSGRRVIDSIARETPRRAQDTSTNTKGRRNVMKDLKSGPQRFKSMRDKFFVIPNAWSVGEVRKLEKLGFGPWPLSPSTS
jgi:hypothetical protein